MRTFWSRVRATFGRRRAERELDETVRAHLDMLAGEFEEQGMSAADARAAARRAFGAVEPMKEVYRERRGLAWLESFAQDLGYGLRGLRRSPGFTAAAVLSLALGIGANTAIFSLFYTLMLRMLPVRSPEQLVVLQVTGGWGRGFMSYPLYQEMRERRDLFAGVLARSGVMKSRFRDGFAGMEFVSGNYFQVLGVQPALGRLLSEDRAPIAVLSYDFWRTRLGGDPEVVGRRIEIDERHLTIVGVAPRGFRGVSVEDRPDVWVPLLNGPWNIASPSSRWIWAVARRNPGLSQERIQAAVDVAMQHHLQFHYGSGKPSYYRAKSMEQRLQVRPASAGLSMLREQFKKPLRVLLLVVGLVLLVACASVANLLLARATGRRRETALRIWLGASRGRLVRQGLTECGLLAALGALAGLALGLWGSHGILWFLPDAALDVRLDGTVLAFTAGVAVLATLLAGLLPTWQSMGMRRAVVVAQVAFSLVLAVAAGLFSRSLTGLRALDMGFRADPVLSFELAYPRAYTFEQAAAVRQRFLERVGALPGVVSVSFGRPGPYQNGSSSRGVRVSGSERTVNVELQAVGARYFETIGSPLVRGREFGAADGAAARRVAVVNEAFAREYFDGADPMERVLDFGNGPTYVVGLARNMLHQGLREHAIPMVYLPFAQSARLPGAVLLVRGPGASQPLLRRELAATDRTVALTDFRTIRERIDDSIVVDRMLAAVSGFFGILALTLAGIGLYGVVAYSVAGRTAEIGVRLALGARRPSVVWMVLREGLLMTAAGVAIGTPLAFVAARVGSSLLFGVKPHDPVTLIGAALVLLAAAVTAAFIPAWRAASIDPARSLRHD